MKVNVSTIDTDCNLINNHFTEQTDNEISKWARDGGRV